ncbi:MAG TPA: endo-1,4-beta-xylanase [Bacteroidetes bacterium]|nr:endo-1,4-beta-xylanase [Bacteroidota bacterium]
MLLAGNISCHKENPLPEEKDSRPKNLEEYYQVTEGLKDYYTPDEYFLMGAAIEPVSTDDPDDITLMQRHYNSLTAENVMKWSSLQPVEGNFHFDPADRIVDFAQANGMKVRGHTLCWHNQLPEWVFKDGEGVASKELVLQRLRNHITTVVNHFKGKVYAWDVVNEAIADGSEIYRNSQWYGICGTDYIFEAFRAARDADPDARLYYNDYAATNPAKTDKIYHLLSQLQDENLVDGVGLQGHWNIEAPSNDVIISALEKYLSLGVEIQITEMDVSVYPSNNDPETEYTEAVALSQAVAYGRFFGLFRSYREHITGVTFWGLADNKTWLDNFPVPGRKNYPFLFDEEYKPKRAYFTVIDF